MEDPAGWFYLLGGQWGIREASIYDCKGTIVPYSLLHTRKFMYKVVRLSVPFWILYVNSVGRYFRAFPDKLKDGLRDHNYRQAL